MGSSVTNTILRQKASVGRQEHQSRAMTVAKAMRISTSKIADELLDMSMSVIGIVVEKREAEACQELLDETALMAALDGPNRTRGGVVISTDVVGGLIQQQTMSRVTAPLGDPRRMTNTDVAMCAPLIDALLIRVPLLLDDDDEKAMMTGFATGTRADEPRIMSMWLDAPEYHVIRMTIDMAAGARQGQVTLILPIVPEHSTLFEDEGDDGTGVGKPTLSASVLSVPAQLNIILCQIKMPFTDLQACKPGDVLHLPHNSFPDAEIRTNTGRILGTGTIGQVDGMRAMRLKREPIYATQPRRRLSDQDDLDLPEIQQLTGPGADNVTKGSFGEVERDSDSPAALPHNNRMDDFPAPDLPYMDSDEGASQAGSELMALPDIAGLPELDDLPDLAATTTDLPALDDLVTPEGGSEGLPDFDALPDLDDLPDLSELPELANLS